MKKIFTTIFTFTMLLAPIVGQSAFELDTYIKRLEKNQALTNDQLNQAYPLPGSYFSLDKSDFDVKKALFADSVIQKLGLNATELQKLKENHFFVSERLQYATFADAYTDIYVKDLPVMITSDAILHSLHASYDDMLKSIELTKLKPNLLHALQQMHGNIPKLYTEYGDSTQFKTYFEDVDLYITVALQLLDPTQIYPVTFCPQDKKDEVLLAVKNESLESLALFTENPRMLDFSQFTPRGHYNDDFIRKYGGFPFLKSYFQSSIWLGFIDFLLTKPLQDNSYTKEDIRRMCTSAAFINELYFMSGANETLLQNEKVIRFMVGESDNITPDEYKTALTNAGIKRASDLLNDEKYEQLSTELLLSEAYQQKILSAIICSDPMNPESAVLPVSYKLFGQRYIIDSHVLGNVVFDKVKTQPLRMMPNPLDAMFALGNNHALPLLKNELETYKYGPQLDAMRYLIDNYDDSFWQSTLYSAWLNSIRSLNKLPDQSNLPFFAQTSAWQHKQLNTQLASWAQLRHDNLLYAKQSYSGSNGCSYPDGYVEPYPALYHNLKLFALSASENLGEKIFGEPTPYATFWSYFANVMDSLENIALTEAQGIALNTNQIEFIQGMLKYIPPSNMCGSVPRYNGWYAKLFFQDDYGESKFSDVDFIIADVHTQPTDEYGRMVGKVLHVGLGYINGAIFLGPSNNSEQAPILYSGACFSYYEKITDNFKRFTDQEWENNVWQNAIPERPAWTASYLTNIKGDVQNTDLQVPGEPNYKAWYATPSQVENPTQKEKAFYAFQNGDLYLSFNTLLNCNANVKVYDIDGKIIHQQNYYLGSKTINIGKINKSNGLIFIEISTPNGVYSEPYLLQQ